MTSATYGACYSINSNISGNAKTLWRSSLPGPDLGLTIVVNLEQNQYLQQGITKSAGARFVLQSLISLWVPACLSQKHRLYRGSIRSSLRDGVSILLMD